MFKEAICQDFIITVCDLWQAEKDFQACGLQSALYRAEIQHFKNQIVYCIKENVLLFNFADKFTLK